MRPFFYGRNMYTAKKQIIRPGRVITAGESLPQTPDNDRLFELGYLSKTKRKKTKKPTTNED